MRIYNYLFFKIFQILTVFDDTPVIGAVGVLCWLFLFNSITIMRYIWGLGNTPAIFATFYFNHSIVINSIFGILHFFYYFYRSRYLKIIERYENESKRSLTIGIICTLVFVIASVIIFFKYTVPNVGGIVKK